MTPETIHQRIEPLRENGTLVIVSGVALALLGIVAIMSPLLAGAATVRVAGAALIAAGAFRAVFALHPRSWSASVLGMGVAALSGLTGLAVLAAPAFGLVSLALVLSAYLVVDGVFGAVLALQNRRSPGWGWLLASAASTLVLGAMILDKWPVVMTDPAVVAVGLSMLLTGGAIANLGISPRGMAELVSHARGDC